MKKLHTIVVRKKSVLLSVACLVVCIIAIVLAADLRSDKSVAVTGPNQGYTILAMNDLGMHCYQTDYSGFLILPPGNTLKVQVFKQGTDEAKLITSGIEISYEIIGNTTSADKINFWDYAKYYGYNVKPNIGITGNGLSGTFKLSADGKYYEATAIPITPYNDGSQKLNPYQLAHIKVTDINSGKLLAETDKVVVPVSDEMKCSECHGATGTDRNILTAHDKLSGTSLVKDLDNGKRYKCSDCHQDNILGEPGKQGIPPLSEAMHGFHSSKMSMSSIKPACYSCHPGPVTQCYRGQMYLAGIDCTDASCHGDMTNIAKTQADGRKAWLQEPDCGTCHGPDYSVNVGTLYRNSYLMNGPDPEMNGIILCASCHNSPHGEWKSSQPKDNLLPHSLLGYDSYINECSVCHNGRGRVHRRR